MNDRYLFRGKRKDRQGWIEGDLVHTRTTTQGVVTEIYTLDMSYEVDPETVGQCTGLKDKNGKLIFEGDVVRTQPFSDKPYSSKAKYKQHIGVVEYRVRRFKNSLYEQYYKAEWIVNIKDYGKFTCYDWSEFFKCKVIGNIHDNSLEDFRSER